MSGFCVSGQSLCRRGTAIPCGWDSRVRGRLSLISSGLWEGRSELSVPRIWLTKPWQRHCRVVGYERGLWARRAGGTVCSLPPGMCGWWDRGQRRGTGARAPQVCLATGWGRPEVPECHLTLLFRPCHAALWQQRHVLQGGDRGQRGQEPRDVKNDRDGGLLPAQCESWHLLCAARRWAGQGVVKDAVGKRRPCWASCSLASEPRREKGPLETA